MKFTPFIFVSVFIFSSCNVPKDGEQENIPTSKLEALTMLDDEKDSTKAETNAAIDSTKPILIARGSEPGWYAEFFKGHLQLVTDYGKDTLSLKHDFSDLISSKNYTYSETIKGIASTTSKSTEARELKIIISSEACTEEASGEKREKHAFIQLNNRVYKGCAYKPQ